MITSAKWPLDKTEATASTEAKVFLAPMEGVVDFVMRDLLSRIGGLDQCVTEFVRVTDRLVPPAVFYRFCPELKTGGRTRSGVPVYIQLLGGQPGPLGENAARAAELGAPGIDLNFGCPAKTVNRHDGGATLLKNPHRLYDIVSAVRKQVPAEVPVTAKVRLGFDSKELCLDIARAVDEASASRLTIHARTKVEGYRPPAHWEYIAEMREAVQVPVVANGDVWSLADYIQCRKVTGCQDVALGRGLIACPDLARQAQAHNKGLHQPGLEWSEVRSDLLPSFFFACRDQGSPEYAVSRMKQWVKLLGRQYPQAKTLFEEIKRKREFFEMAPYFSDDSQQPSSDTAG